MGVLGSEDTNGDFKVVDICYAGQGPQEQPSSMETGIEGFHFPFLVYICIMVYSNKCRTSIQMKQTSTSH